MTAANFFKTRVISPAILRKNNLQLEPVVAWSSSIIRWGGAALIGALLFTEGVPRVQRDVLSRIPLVGKHWAREEVVEE